MKTRKKILIISFLDGFANNSKTKEINKYLRNSQAKIYTLDTVNIFHISVKHEEIILKKFPILNLNNLLLYSTLKIKTFLQNHFSWIYTKKFYVLQQTEMILRAKIIKKFVDELKPDLIIGESQIDSLLFSYTLRMKTFFDCPTPLADEEFFGGQLTKMEYTHFLKQELNIYNNVDYLSFHWQSYGDYVRGGNYQYKKNNIITFNAGCDIKEKKAQYSRTPRIVYLGYLGGYYIDLELLSRLSKMYPHIDVYGSPPPDKLLGLNYKGYANPDVVANYQFGLITITKDPLRRKGFSAKHLEYISYGLPVLVPDWRENLDLIDGSIPYNETNFLNKVSEFSNQKSWMNMQKRALNQAKKLSWNETLKPLDNIIKSL